MHKHTKLSISALKLQVQDSQLSLLTNVQIMLLAMPHYQHCAVMSVEQEVYILRAHVFGLIYTYVCELIYMSCLKTDVVVHVLILLLPLSQDIFTIVTISPK